jgi:ureidoglycolate lyase
MLKVRAEILSKDAFAPFGTFHSLDCRGCEVLGEPPIEFFRDLHIQSVAGSNIAWSLCRVSKRPPVIDTAEFHSCSSEALVALDGDMYFFVGPATPKGSPFPALRVKVFRVPQFTTIIIRPGVWHHAPFVVASERLNVLVTLPERTYANDCFVSKLNDDERIEVITS